MNILGIPKKLLVTLVLIVSGTLLATSSFFTADRVELLPDRVGVEANETLEELKALDRQLCNILRVGNRRSPILCRIAFSEKTPQGEVLLQRVKNIWTIEFNDRTPGWKDSFYMRTRILAWLLATKLNNPELAERPDRFPSWVVAGIDARIEGSRFSERLLRRNRQLPVLRALLAVGQLPNFHQTMEMDPAELTESGRIWYREISRVLVDSAYALSSATDNAFLAYLELLSSGSVDPDQAFRSTLGRLWLTATNKSPLLGNLSLEEWNKLGDDVKVQRYLEYVAERLAWHELSPRPAIQFQKQLEQVMHIELPELNDAGEPTGKQLQISYNDLPGIIPDRPDATQLIREEANRLQGLVEGNNLAFRRYLQTLEIKLLALPTTRKSARNPQPAQEFRQALEQLAKVVERYVAIEQFLEKYERSIRAPFVLYGSRMREASRPDEVLSLRVREFLERTEALYLQE